MSKSTEDNDSLNRLFGSSIARSSRRAAFFPEQEKVAPAPATGTSCCSAYFAEIKSLLSGNAIEFSHLTKKTNEVLDEISKLRSKNYLCREANMELREQNDLLATKIKSVEFKMRYNENYARKKNLIFYNMDSVYECVDSISCEMAIRCYVENFLAVDTSNMIFDVVLKFPWRYRQNQSWNPIIIAKFLKYADRAEIMGAYRNLRRINGDTMPEDDVHRIAVGEDLCYESRQIREKLVPHLFEARHAGKRATLRDERLCINGEWYTIDLENDDLLVNFPVLNPQM